MTIQDKEMLHDLIVESREHLLEIEPDLLELEQKGDGISQELINRVFRAVHSIKGGFGFFAIAHITELSHAMENVLARIRDKEISITADITDALLKGVDKLRVLLDDVSHAETIAIVSDLQALAPFLNERARGTPKGTSTAAAPPTPALGLDESVRRNHPDVTNEQLLETIRNGRHLYKIAVNSHSDLLDQQLTPAKLIETWEKLGDVLDVSFDFSNITGIEGSTDQELQYSILFSTVLESDLVGDGLSIPAEQILAIDLSAMRAQLLKKNTDAGNPDRILPAQTVPENTGNDTAKDKSKYGEAKVEDALRVKVGLLNNLMNLAGELVLSRNQLIQSVNRKLSESVETDALLKNLNVQIASSCKAFEKAVSENPQQLSRISAAEEIRLRESFMSALSIRMIDIPGYNTIIQNINMVTSLLQESIMQTRLQPISVVFAKFPRLVRDVAKKLGKEVNLTLVGQDVELDKSIVEQLSDPLTHLIRNSIDHGIESPETRRNAGKPEQGEVILRAFHEGGKVHIQIQDNGAGINRVRVKEKALKLGFFTSDQLASMSDREIDGIVMLPAFSTASEVSDISGRGVGMDVVKTNIERLGGTVDIESRSGQGTTITMRLPLTLAIISSLIVETSGRRFAIPQVGIEELVRIRAGDITRKIERVKGCEVMRLRGKLLPLVRLTAVLGMVPVYCNSETGEQEIDKRQRWSDRRKNESGDVRDPRDETQAAEEKRKQESGGDRRVSVRNAVKIVVLKYGEQHFGLIVDNVHDSEEIVVKPLSGYLKSCMCYAGSTIMGDGSVAMILDTNGIAAASGLKFNVLAKDIENEKAKIQHVTGTQERELLLFTAGENGNFGIDLSRVARVEKVETSRVQSVGDKQFLKYEDHSLRLLRLPDYLPVAHRNASNSELFIIVPKGVKYLMGIVAESVQDVIKTDTELDTGNIRSPGVAGSLIIGGALTLVISLDDIFRAAEPELCA